MLLPNWNTYICVCVCVCVCVCGVYVCVYIYIYIYIKQREREVLKHQVILRRKDCQVNLNKLGKRIGAEKGQVKGSNLRALFRINKKTLVGWKEISLKCISITFIFSSCSCFFILLLNLLNLENRDELLVFEYVLPNTAQQIQDR
jgi:hypothetical protein